jgi:thiazole synthase ThiGH ThiG subunit
MVAMNAPVETAALDDPLVIAGRAYRSRLLVGTGKYRDFAQTREAVVASGAQIVTVAIRRTNIGQDAGAPSLIDALPPSEFTYLPNSAAAIRRMTRCARSSSRANCSTATRSTKLEVLGDKETLYPQRARDAEGGRDAGGRRLPRDGVHVRRSHHRARSGSRSAVWR